MKQLFILIIIITFFSGCGFQIKNIQPETICTFPSIEDFYKEKYKTIHDLKGKNFQIEFTEYLYLSNGSQLAAIDLKDFFDSSKVYCDCVEGQFYYYDNRSNTFSSNMMVFKNSNSMPFFESLEQYVPNARANIAYVQAYQNYKSKFACIKNGKTLFSGHGFSERIPEAIVTGKPLFSFYHNINLE